MVNLDQIQEGAEITAQAQVVEAQGTVITDETVLVQPLKEVELTDDHKATFEHIKGLKVKTTPEKLFEINYNNEIKRLKVNASSVESKRKAAAKKAGLTMEQYLEQLGTTSGGGRKTEYKYTEEQYAECKDKLKVLSTLSVEEQCLWLTIDLEAKRYKANQASKKAIDKKKNKAIEGEVVVNETVVAEVVDAEVVDSIQDAEIVTVD